MNEHFANFKRKEVLMTFLRFSLDFNWQFSAQCESDKNIYSAKLSLFRGKFLPRLSTTRHYDTKFTFSCIITTIRRA